MKNENGEGMGITYVIMPIEILQNKELSCNEKILYCYLNLFKKGVCFQSNEKLCEMTGLEERTLQRSLKKLAETKYIFIEYVNNNSAMRRIYVVLDNPKKLEYLVKKGMFSISPKPAVAETEPKNEEPEPIVDISSLKIRPKKSDYKTDEEYEKAFYAWNSRAIM
jgi:hypothetical protein